MKQKKLRQAVEWPIKYSSSFARLGISPTRGILLHGPPGCSKTTLAKAIAHVTQASFFSLRGGSSSSNSRVGDKILSTLLTEMDGLEESKGVIVLAATNLVDAIDPALRRSGRFDEVLHVPLPDSEGRHEILQIHTRKLNMDDEVDIRRIAEGTEGFSGADLANLCTRIGMIALSEDMSATTVYNTYFRTAIRSVKEPPTIIIRSVKAACIKQKGKGTQKLLLRAIPAIILIIFAGINTFLHE